MMLRITEVIHCIGIFKEEEASMLLIILFNINCFLFWFSKKTKLISMGHKIEYYLIGC